jgi:hypothetical protein
LRGVSRAALLPGTSIAVGRGGGVSVRDLQTEFDALGTSARAAPSLALTREPAENRQPLFESFYLAGFECSDHKLEGGRRLDLLASTQHDVFARADYMRARAAGLRACRDGISWVRCEPRPGQYDFSSWYSRLRAAADHVEVIWDLMHFGWPDHVDVFSPRFPASFARYAREVARFHYDHSDARPMFTLINEMSFLSWAGGDVRCMNPFKLARGDELKVQFVLATIEAIEAIRDVLPKARFVHPEPVINIVPSPEFPKTWRRVECDNLLQYEALDMLAGQVWTRLGGHPKYLDIVGINYYPDNQFTVVGATLFRGQPGYEPFSQLLLKVWRRYRRPMLITETGAEGEERAPWLRYVSAECLSAMAQGCELHGLTLYPVLDHPGWLDDRHCPNGLWSYADGTGARATCVPLMHAMKESEDALLTARAALLSMPQAQYAMAE